MSDTDQISAPHQRPLGDESFMSAEDLRSYMDKVATAHAKEMVEAVEKADRARDELAKTLAAPIELTPQRLEEITQNLLVKLRSAAERGETELMVMRFPNSLCTDHGRAINNTVEGWPDTLTGRPRQAYELWRDRLKPAGFGLTAMIVDWPKGMPGDVGLFLTWGRK
ncbi:conserved hypothetical protein [Ancylobacter novellus DSM 506]|uniref:Uncharacterized protein n=1 Tax=Ancylobacter novellus (strain ATCC 8093 / DSM 506 / JCM 20403 / CCM 1077 / IAM 12100 / NBRC 12443 / NCIMB 10456) TaxID=639283 RepID=D7A9S0_ANCN5|nr:hypothetical protein [Ancylobacter novellus]ADH88846.1 conserved hypothetical protein [Ancylobacter novellus DSM 506]